MNPSRLSLGNFFPVLFLSAFLNASCKPGHNIPSPGEPLQTVFHMDSIRIDGEKGDWPVSPGAFRVYSDVRGNVPDTSDFSARFRLAWNRDGLLVLAEVTDDVIYEDPSRFWNGDGMELFVSPLKGSPDIVQYSVRPSFYPGDSTSAVNYYDHRNSDTLLNIRPSAYFRSKKTPSGYRLEGRIPLEAIGISQASSGMEMAVQLYINDSDREKDTSNYSLPWYPVRDSYRNPYAFFRVRLALSAKQKTSPEVRAYIVDDRSLHIKVLSSKSSGRGNMKLVSGSTEKRFSLLQEEHGLYCKQMEFSLKKLGPDPEVLQFMWQDSLFFSIDPCVLYRVYEHIPVPNRFEEEIRIFEITDHFKPPPQDAVLFTGSSTIRRWTDIERYLPGVILMNRGFGGSTMKDLNYYSGRIVFPYHPSRIFIYEGDNDLARGSSPAEFIVDCREFIEACKKNIPEAEIFFLSIKPSLARIRNWADMQVANRMLGRLAEEHENVRFINISDGMLDPEGHPRKDLFVEDGLHLNAAGYEILSEAVRPALYE